jgi:hypothetical protein
VQSRPLTWTLVFDENNVTPVRPACSLSLFLRKNCTLFGQEFDVFLVKLCVNIFRKLGGVCLSVQLSTQLVDFLEQMMNTVPAAIRV